MWLWLNLSEEKMCPFSPGLSGACRQHPGSLPAGPGALPVVPGCWCPVCRVTQLVGTLWHMPTPWMVDVPSSCGPVAIPVLPCLSVFPVVTDTGDGFYCQTEVYLSSCRGSSEVCSSVGAAWVAGYLVAYMEQYLLNEPGGNCSRGCI